MRTDQKLGKPPVLAAHELEHVAGLFERLGAGRVVRPLPPPIVWSVYVFVNGFLTIGLLSLVAVVTRTPFVFPSLGPTAYLLFFSPRADAASPHNTLVGHAIGLVCGYAAFWILGTPYPGATTGALYWQRILAAALSLAATGALMILAKASHPPAGATTLIVSLGIITRPAYLVVIETAVLLLTIQAFCINRFAGVPYPLWKRRGAG